MKEPKTSRQIPILGERSHFEPSREEYKKINEKRPQSRSQFLVKEVILNLFERIAKNRCEMIKSSVILISWRDRTLAWRMSSPGHHS